MQLFKAQQLYYHLSHLPPTQPVSQEQEKATTSISPYS